MSADACRVEWWGHSTVAIEMAGVRLLTDPLLTARAVHLLRAARPVPDAALAADAVLISHFHMDHLHLRSLRRLGPRWLIGPPGLAALTAGLDARVTEVEPSDEVMVGALRVRAVPADHEGRRTPWGAYAPPLGFVIAGPRRVYFAGDTDLFDGMRALGRLGLDVALLPVWGWGSSLGRGRHLDPHRAARAAAWLHPRVAVPIHWGTYAPAWALRGHPPAFLTRPARDFAAHAAELAPGVRVVRLRPGGAPLRVG